jgi:hypothetical protein
MQHPLDGRAAEDVARTLEQEPLAVASERARRLLAIRRRLALQEVLASARLELGGEAGLREHGTLESIESLLDFIGFKAHGREIVGFEREARAGLTNAQASASFAA